MLKSYEEKNLRVLGTAKIGSIPKRSAHKLLNELNSININILDTAPSYPKSESRIGYFSLINPNDLRILTKFGRGNQILNSKLMIQSLDTSLQRLKIKQVFGLSIHNRGLPEIPEEIFDCAIKLKDTGKILNFGWCGEWEKLPISKIHKFDYVMLPINPFVGDFRGMIEKINVPVIAMNPFANFFWNYKVTNMVISLYNEKVRKIFNPKPSNLQHSSAFSEPPKLDDLLEFVASFKQVNGICFGSTKFEHIKQITNSLDKLGF